MLPVNVKEYYFALFHPTEKNHVTFEILFETMGHIHHKRQLSNL